MKYVRVIVDLGAKSESTELQVTTNIYLPIFERILGRSLNFPPIFSSNNIRTKRQRKYFQRHLKTNKDNTPTQNNTNKTNMVESIWFNVHFMLCSFRSQHKNVNSPWLSFLSENGIRTYIHTYTHPYSHNRILKI